MLRRFVILGLVANLAPGCGGSDRGSASPAAPTAAPPVLQTIAELTGIAVDTGPIAVGQSVTAPSGSFANLRFRFLVPNGGEPANGSLFLLNREYLGTPAGLNATTAGVLASTSRLENGEWIFEQGVTLPGGATYWFVTGSRMRVFTTPDGARDFYAGGDVYTTGAENFPFNLFRPSSTARIDALFQLRGGSSPQ